MLLSSPVYTARVSLIESCHRRNAIEASHRCQAKSLR